VKCSSDRRGILAVERDVESREREVVLKKKGWIAPKNNKTPALRLMFYH
jgi:hypothetical protein